MATDKSKSPELCASEACLALVVAPVGSSLHKQTPGRSAITP